MDVTRLTEVVRFDVFSKDINKYKGAVGLIHYIAKSIYPYLQVYALE